MTWISSALLILTLAPVISQNTASGQQPAVVVVNGVAIDRWELDREFQNLLPQSSFHRRLEGERRTELEKKALDVLVMKELKHQWAEAQGLSIDSSAVDRELMKIRERFPDEANYRQALVDRGMSEGGLRRAIERDHFAEVVDERVLIGVPEPTSDDVERFFAANRTDYVTPESRHVIHVLVYVAPSASAVVWESGSAEAAAVAASARAGTMDLVEEALRRRAEIPPRYRDQTGDLGMIHLGALQADVDEAVFSASVGEVVGPVRTIYGYSVLQVLSVDPPRQIELKQVRDSVFSRLRDDRSRDALAEFERQLLTAADVERESLSAER